MNFQMEFDERREQVEAVLKKYLPKEEGFQKTVIEAMNYSILAGGKRLRPILMQETFRICGGEGQIIEPFMAAIEFIHTYSLVHDDLPAMDNDVLRRGRKTTHAAYGHAMGILAGDALLNSAFEILAEAFEKLAYLPDEEYLKTARRFGKAQHVLIEKAGIYGMVGGQVVDVETTEKKEPLTKEKLKFIYHLKTGALMEASMVAGAYLAGAEATIIEKLYQIAEDIGLAFQIQDDILDITSTTEVLGKSVMSDEKNQKMTYVAMEGIQKSIEDVKEISDRALQTLKGLSKDTKFLEELIWYLIYRKK